MRSSFFLLAIALLVAPSTALRGTQLTRALQTDEEVSSKTTTKKSTSDKSKKDKKKCKKADKYFGKEQKSKSKSKSKSKESSPKEDPTRARFLQLPEVEEEEVPYCLHAEFTAEACADQASLPRDGSLQSGLSLQLIRSEDQDSNEIVQNVREILSSDTNSRFVGCRPMLDPASPKSKSKSKEEPKRHHRHQRKVRRGLQTMEEEDENITYEESDSNVDVTGVTFNNLSIESGGKLWKSKDSL